MLGSKDFTTVINSSAKKKFNTESLESTSTYSIKVYSGKFLFERQTIVDSMFFFD